MSVKKAKEKIAKKVAKGKKKVAKKCGVLFALIALGTLAGCQNPAQRSQTCEVRIYAYDASKVTLGTESVTLAQSNETGGNDAGLTASPKTDVSPDIDTTVGGMGGGGGVLENAINSGVRALCAPDTTAPATATTQCAGGVCNPCSDGACSCNGK